MSDGTASRRRSRGGGGAARRAERTSVNFETAKYIERNIPLFNILNDEALEIINKWNASDVLNAYIEAPTKGFKTVLANKTLLEWGKIFLSLAKKGLVNRSIKNTKDKDETIFLQSIESILNNNSSKATNAIRKFKKQRHFLLNVC